VVSVDVFGFLVLMVVFHFFLFVKTVLYIIEVHYEEVYHFV
jgi:hypothetical protein